MSASTLFWVNSREARAAASPAMLQSGDTVNVFMESYATSNGAETQHVDAFTTTVVPLRRYVVRVARWAGTLSKADVYFNRLKIATLADLPPDGPFHKVVQMLPSDTLDVRVAGSAGAAVRVWVRSVPDPTYTIRGPIRYNKSNQFVPDTFAVAAPPASAPYYAYITNGPSGTNRANSLDLRLNGTNLTVPPEFGTNLPGFVIQLPLVNGQNILAAKVGGANGAAVDIRTVSTDVIPPQMTITTPVHGFITKLLNLHTLGQAIDSTLATITLNGVPDIPGPSGVFDPWVALPVEGVNVLTFRATDRAGLFTEVVREVIRDTQSPVLNVAVPQEGHTTSDATLAVSGTVSDLTAVTVNVNGTPLTVQSGNFSGSVALEMGLNVLSFTATDAATNATTVVRQVTRSNTVLPPDPSTVAPALNLTVSTNMFDATNFLYTGANPIQTGVVAGTIKPARVSVLKGKVKDRADAAISGVEISILGHPEYGTTYTRADGAFDIAVNGGTLVTVDYKKNGLLPVQRPLDPTVQDFEVMDDVVMIPVDTAVSVVNFTPPITVHRGSTVSDADGTRRPTLMFAQGTVATMVMPDSSTQPLSSITVRATEYSVGNSGPLAMPAPLPGTAGYTFTVELSADEAIAAGAKSVQFSKPVAVYVENFLGFPVGLTIPTAFQDRTTGAWTPTPNGKIIKIIGVSGGMATISLDSLGTQADSASLAALGITTAERQELATLYSVGQSLWRFQVTHFSATGVYCPAGPTPGAEPPNVAQPTNPQEPSGCAKGSIIECSTQVLGEEIDVAGAPFRLAYRSARTKGYQDAYRQEINVIGATVPPLLLRADVEWEVAGKHFTQTFQPQPNQRFTIAWDGKDAYGRRVQGRKPLTVRIDYVYRLLYLVPPSEASSFGLLCYGSGGSYNFYSTCVVDSVDCACGGGRSEVKLGRDYSLWIGEQDIEAERTGSWTPSIHHRFDPVSRVLYLGDGRRRDPKDVLETVAGTGAQGFSGDGGQARLAQLLDPMGVALAKDGSVYFSDRNFRIRRIAPDGIITTIAGNGQFGVAGDGGPALQASISNGPLAVGPDGSIYLAQWSFGTIRRIWPNGTITRAAGDPAIAFCVPDEDPDSLAVRAACMGDGGLAVNASIWGPYGLEVGPDGSIYFADGNNAIRKVSPNGIVTTIAGGGWAGWFCKYNNAFPWTDQACGDGGPARIAGTESTPTSLALGPDGSLYFLDAGNGALRRIWPNGVITRFAGTGSGSGGFSGDGGPATSALISAENGLAVGPDGSVYIGAINRIRRVAPNGIITTIAGGGVLPFQCGVPNPPTCLNYEPATQASMLLERWGDIEVASDGSIYFPTHFGDHRIRRIVPFFRAYDSTGVVIASDDGSEVYEFDPTGRHLRTRDSNTNRILFTFGYDAAGRLTTVTDGDNNVTTLQRNGSGDLTAIVSPFGQQTPVTLDARGFLATITNPAGEAITAVHDTLGLLRTLRDAKNNPPQRFSYDSLGRLVADTASGGNFQLLTRTENDTSVSVTLTSAMGRTQTFKRIEVPTGSLLNLETDQAGLTTEAQVGTNGTTVTTSPDGTVSTLTGRPDPRFGSQAPFLGTFSVALPSGLTLNGSSKRKVTLSNPFNPLTITSQIDSLTVNSRTFVSNWNVAARTLTATSAVGRQTVTVFDSAGRVTEERVTGVAPVKYTYGPRGFLTQVRQSGRILQYDYDSTGRVKKVTDPLGRTEQFLYDSVGRVTTQTLADGRQILYSYDANGNLTSLTPPTKPAHTFFYTTGDLDSLYSPPPAGLSSFRTRYSYNLDQQLTTITRPDSLAITIGYDAFGRPNGLTLPNGSTTIGYHPTSGLLNSLTSVTGGSLAFTYNGSLPTLATWTGAVAGNVGYAYDANFRVTALTVNGANSISLGYDNDNLLTSAGSLTMARDPQNGRLTGTTLGSLTTTHTYDDSVGTPQRNTATYSSTTLLDFQYTRDTLDRITQIIEAVQGTTKTWNYTYDSIGRLDQVRLNTVLVADYAYDGNGNRTGLVTQSGSVTGTVDDQDRLLTYGTNTYTYTSNGELKTKVNGTDTTRYTYDVLGNLLQVKLNNGATTIDYLVDGQNRRIGKKVNGVLTQGFLYQGQLAPIAELDGSNNVVSRFVYGTRVNVPEYMIKAGVTYRLLTDHLGSVRLVVNSATGVVAQRIDYDEFGRVTQNTNPGFQPFGFAGGLLDDATKFVRFGARDYDTETGRWTAKDPIGFNGSIANLFGYVESNPLSYVDITGECPWCIAVAVGGGTDLVVQLIMNGGNWRCINWGQVARAGALSGVGVGIAQKLGKVSTVFGGPTRPTYRFFKAEGIVRAEAHPITRSSPDWLSYPHWHADFLGGLGKRHLPLVEPIAGASSVIANLRKNCPCE